MPLEERLRGEARQGLGPMSLASGLSFHIRLMTMSLHFTHPGQAPQEGLWGSVWVRSEHKVRVGSGKPGRSEVDQG